MTPAQRKELSRPDAPDRPSEPQYREPLESMVNLLEKFKRAHAAVLLRLREVRPTLISGSVDNPTIVDVCWTLEQMSELCEDLRKECDEVSETAGHVVCLSHTVAQVANPLLGDKIKGQLAVGTPDVSMQPKLPKKHEPNEDKEAPKVLTQDYRNLAHDLGVTDEALDNELFHIHWPRLCDYVTRLVQAGRPLPRGIDPASLKAKHVLRIRTKR
jgi:hypothetical protein